jgi:hypothetical protein
LAIVGAVTWGLKRSLDAPPTSTALATNENPRAAQPVAPLAEESKPSGTPDDRSPVAAAAPAPTQAPAAPAQIEDAAAVLDVRIVDTHGAPIPGAEVAIIDRGIDDATRAKSPHATSGADGRVTVNVHRSDGAPNRGRSAALARDEWTLETEYSAPGRERRADHSRFKAGTVTAVGDVVLRPAGALHGQVRLPADALLTKIWIEVYPPDLTLEERRQAVIRGLSTRKKIANASVASDGTYTVRAVPIGSYRVLLAPGSDGWFRSLSDVVEVRAAATTEVPELELNRNPLVVGGIVRAPDQKPARGQHVYFRVSGSNPSGPPGWISESTDAEGRFLIDFPAQSSIDLYFYSEPVKFGEAILREVMTGRTDLDVKLPEPAWIDVLVQDAQHAPIQEFMTGARLVGEDRTRFSRATPHPGGNAKELVRAAPFYLVVSARGFQEKVEGPFDLEHHPSSLVFTLDERSHDLRLRVTADGKPVAKALVELMPVVDRDTHVSCNGFPSRGGVDTWFHAWREITDDEGRCTTTDRENAGRVTAIVRVPGFARAESGPLELGVNAPKDEIEIALTHGGALEGRVIPMENDSPGAVLVGISCGDSRVRVVRSGADGSFRFDAVAAGHWFMRHCEQDFEALGSMDCHEAAGFDPSLTPFDVVEGRTTRCDLDLRNAACTLEGALVIARGPARKWTADVLPSGAQPRNGAGAALDDNGRFHVELSVLGTHRLALTATERDSDQRIDDTLDVHRGVNEWSLSFATGNIEGDAPAGAVLAHVWTSARGTKVTTHFVADAHGHFHVDGVPIGPGRVEIVQPKSKAEPTSVEVTAGELAHVSVH